MEVRQAASLYPDSKATSSAKCSAAPTHCDRRRSTKLHDFGDVFFSKEFVEPRPLLQALSRQGLRAAGRRDRQVRRRIRILLLKSVGLPGQYPRTGHRRGACEAHGDPDLQSASAISAMRSSAGAFICISASPSRSSKNASSRAASPESAIVAQADRRLHQSGPHRLI